MEENLQLAVIFMGLIHIVGSALAGEKRTLGFLGGLLFGLLPIAGPILILAWPPKTAQ